MNRLLILITLALLTSLALPATGMAHESTGLNDRMRTQSSAIERGVTTGTLPAEEARWLKRELRTVRIDAEILSKKNTPSPVNVAMLHARLDQIADTIRCSLAMHTTPQSHPSVAQR
jgi:hypothetical protein